MKFCSKCGKEINEDAVICVNCGCKVESSTEKKPLAQLKTNRGLGKGLSALFSETEEDYGKSLLFDEEPAEKGEGVTQIAISSIFANPNQPRKAFDPFLPPCSSWVWIGTMCPWK